MTQSVVVTITTYPLIAPVIQQTTELTCPANQVTVQMCYSPINPADINMLEGRYVVKPELPFVPGNEGVGKIIAVGEM